MGACSESPTVFLLTPHNVEVSAEERARLLEKRLLQPGGLAARCPEPDAGCRRSTGKPPRTSGIGLIGAGEHGSRDGTWLGRPVLVSDSGSGDALALAEEARGGGGYFNLAVAQGADLVMLCHKPDQLELVGARSRRHERRRIGARRNLDDALQKAYPGRRSFRLMPNTPVEVRQGVSATPRRRGSMRRSRRRSWRCSSGSERVVRIEERLMPAATAVMGVRPRVPRARRRSAGRRRRSTRAEARVRRPARGTRR